MTDQQRFDTIAALGNSDIYTPNMDRLVRRGITFSSAYATCPVCVAARYTIRTGCEPATTRVFSNAKADAASGQAVEMEARCEPYLGRTMSRLGYRTLESASSIRIRGTRIWVSKRCGAAKKLIIRQIAKAMITDRGWCGSIRSSISWSNPWANGLRCFTFRNAARFRPI